MCKLIVIFQTTFVNVVCHLTKTMRTEGHKHLCIFKFEAQIPDIINLLHKGEEKFSTSPKGQTKLGFCDSKNFNSITKRLEKILKLKEQYGEKWKEYDDGE